MFNNFLKNLSILRKFLFINFLIFIIIGLITILYLSSVQPNLIKAKRSNHIEILNNTIGHFNRLNIGFNNDEIRNFLFSTRFLFQNLDRVTIFDNDFNLIGDTDTLDLDPRSFGQTSEVIQMDSLNDNTFDDKNNKSEKSNSKVFTLNKRVENYALSKEIGKPFTFIEENYNQFILVTLKNVSNETGNIGYIAISENSLDIKAAIEERKNFILRTAILVAIVILIFSFVLNRYFLKPIKNLVDYTKIIKSKSKKETKIDQIKNRNDELGVLSKSLDEMTKELNSRIKATENFSTDLVHEIRNPLASLKSASEIISDTTDKEKQEKLLKIMTHDVSRIDRLITDYSQILKDELAISSEQMEDLDLKPIIESVVDDFNNIYIEKKNINIKLITSGLNNYFVKGISNRVEQIIANLLDNAVSFSKEKSIVTVNLDEDQNFIVLKVSDEGEGFKESDIKKVFDRFYSNRPENFGEHSGLGLNIVKNLVQIHKGEIHASNSPKGGAMIEIKFPKNYN
ncbi:HAMP domain-containing histidine kinase [Candidatus Pelagibacter sp.]|nr:HAMP domain-containing histidine kinase [Candidatus Pelagibacter sp.]